MGVMNINYEFFENVGLYSRYPDTILMGLTEVGGLLALLNIGIALRFFHKRYFE